MAQTPQSPQPETTESLSDLHDFARQLGIELIDMDDDTELDCE